MVQPFYGADGAEFIAFEHLPGAVEHRACHQNLPGRRQRHDSRACINLNPKQIRVGLPFKLSSQDHFPDVNSNTLLRTDTLPDENLP